MPKKSTRENKSIYQTAREEAGLTREKASAETGCLSESVIEKIEYGQVNVYPDQVLAMARAYKKPELCNYYCTQECEIGRYYVPEVKITELSQIVLHMLASLNALEKERDRLIEITVDGEVADDELADFARIKRMIDHLSMTADAMSLWIEKSIVSGNVDAGKFQEVMRELPE